MSSQRLYKDKSLNKSTVQGSKDSKRLDSKDGSARKLVTSGSRRKALSPSSDLNLQNWYNALSQRKGTSSFWENCLSVSGRWKQPVTVIGDNLLQETKAPIC